MSFVCGIFRTPFASSPRSIERQAGSIRKGQDIDSDVITVNIACVLYVPIGT